MTSTKVTSPAAGVSNTMSVSNIAIFVPNLIGYVRIALSITSFYVAQDYPLLFLFLYTTSFVLDAADGMAARALNQCSHFGAILDMLTDRASTAGLVVVLDKVIQPMPYSYTFILATFVFLDVASHFCRMYATLFVRKESHKDVSDSIFWLLRIYYSQRKVMGVLCIGQEFALIFLYAAHMYQNVYVVGSLLWMTCYVALIPCVVKQIVNVQQLIDGLYHIGTIDVIERNTKAAQETLTSERQKA